MKAATDRDILMKMTFKRLLIIQILSSFSAFIGPFIDGIIVSDFLGSEYMAAFGIVAPITIFAGALSNIFNAGSQNIAGKYLGQGRSDKLNNLLTTTVLWAVITGVVITLLLVVLKRPVLTLLGANAQTMQICDEYLSMYIIGITPTILMPTLVGFLQLDNGGKTAVTASIVMTISDVILDLLAVLVFKNGMIGIGIATTGSYIIAVLILLTHFLKKNINLKFTFKESIVNDIKKIIICGLPAATFLLCNMVRVSATNNIILGVSDLDSVAAFSIQNTFRPLTLAFVLGTGLTTLLVCSVISGEENRHSMRKELGYILKVGIIISVILAAVVVAFAKYPFAIMFCVGQSEEFVALVTTVIRLFAISIPFSMINIIIIYYYQSMRKLWRSTLIIILQNVVYYLIVAKILSMIIGVDGVWIGYIISEVLTLLTIIISTWIENKHFPIHIHDYLLLPNNFGVSVENRINITATSKEEATQISKEIAWFCRNKNIERNRALAAGLCIEELAAIAIEDANTNKTYVDIYITYKEGKLNIRMMDNSKPFDKKILEGVDENDPCAHVGIRIVKGMTQEISYQVVLGMNMYSMVI